jgi:hypothetical protein
MTPDGRKRMTTKPDPRSRTYHGREICTEIVKAVEALPTEAEIVTFETGENMPITAAILMDGEYDGVGIPLYAWNGEAWDEIGEV